MHRFTDSSTMPYGKYRGRAMGDVPASYLIWMHESGKCSLAVATYIEDNMDAIRQRRDAETAARKSKSATQMPYGRYKGVELIHVPAEYLLAVYEGGKCPVNVSEYVRRNIDVIERQADRARQNRALLRSMYR